MKSALKLASAVGLALTVIPSVLVLMGSITWSEHAAAMLTGTLIWFVTAPFWMKERDPAKA